MQHQEKLINDERIIIRLPIIRKIEFNKKRDDLGMNSSQFIIHLLDQFEGNNLSVIKNFRYNLNKRIKKGIDRNYLYELTKLRDQLNILIERI